MSTLNWDRDGLDWPNREASRFVDAGGLKWHVQDLGSGPVVLLVHGTAASTHSWRDLAPLLATRFRVIAMDLPGHGFTQSPRPSRLTPAFMASGIADLLKTLDVRPSLAVGHSAGAAILARMAFDGSLTSNIVSLNGALLPWRGFVSQYFPAMARALFINPFLPEIFAWRAKDMGTIRRLLGDTGSTIDERGLLLYQRLFQTSTHVAAALGMMASWDLESLQPDLPKLGAGLTLIAASNDRAIPVDAAFTVRDRVPGSVAVVVRGLGHLCHEERPSEIVPLIVAAAERAGVFAENADAGPHL